MRSKCLLMCAAGGGRVDSRQALRGRAYINVVVLGTQICLCLDVRPKQVVVASRSNMNGSNAVPCDPEDQML